MRRVAGVVVGLAALLFAVAPAAAAAPRPVTHTTTTADPGVWPLYGNVNQISWVRACASMSCGYHQIPTGRKVAIWCQYWDGAIWWELVTAASPWDPRLPIAGYIDARATNQGTFESCNSVGVGGDPLPVETWAHSCPLLNCGYGVIPLTWPRHDVAGVCTTDVPFEGFYWVLVLDHNNAAPGMVGFIHREHYPRTDPDVPCVYTF